MALEIPTPSQRPLVPYRPVRALSLPCHAAPTPTWDASTRPSHRQSLPPVGPTTAESSPQPRDTEPSTSDAASTVASVSNSASTSTRTEANKRITTKRKRAPTYQSEEESLPASNTMNDMEHDAPTVASNSHAAQHENNHWPCQEISPELLLCSRYMRASSGRHGSRRNAVDFSAARQVVEATMRANVMAYVGCGGAGSDVEEHIEERGGAFAAPDGVVGHE